MRHHNAHRDVVVVGASAGGVEALCEFFRNLPPDLAAALLVVLHIPPDANSQLVRILSGRTSLPVKFAEEDELVEQGKCYVASPDRHLMLQDGRIRITRGPRESRARPSIDVLFRSASQAFGSRVIAVILSGTLDDGTAGAWAIKDRNGVVLAQDPVEAMHASMPQSAIRHVKVDLVGTASQLAETVAGLVGQPVSDTKTSVRGGPEIENLIAMEGNGLKAGVMELGKISKYTCPDCHGVLVQINEGSIVRFRCHTGHAFSLLSLLAEVNESIDTGLWDTLRAIEERIMLLEQMAALAHESNQAQEATDCERQAKDAKARVQAIRDLVLDPKFFGHDKKI